MGVKFPFLLDLLSDIDSILKLLGDLPVDIPGGEIVRDPGMGVLCDSALTLVEDISPLPSDVDRLTTIKLAMKSLNSVGLVGVHDAGVFPNELVLYKKYHPLPRHGNHSLADTRELSLRIY